MIPPKLKALDIHIKKDTGGYDAKDYIPFAIDPLLQDPNTANYIDRASYRVRRLAMPWFSWELGFGNPAWIIQVYSSINILCWLVLAFYLRSKLNNLKSLEDCCRWFACMFSVGTLDSVRLALTDLPLPTLLCNA